MKSNKLSVKFFLLFILIFLFAGQVTVEGFEPSDSVRSVISGKDDLNVKCGLPFILQAHAPGNESLFKELQLYSLNKNFLDLTYLSPSGHFLIHYTRNGSDAIPAYDRDNNGIPDYLEFVAKSFDRAWQIEVDSLGFKPPPDSSGANRDIYPIYCKRARYLGQDVYGQTFLDYEIQNLEGLNYVTSIEIHTDFDAVGLGGVSYPGVTDPVIRDSMAIAVTAAHEFNHATQFGYRLWPDNTFFHDFHDFWFIESSATYMEEVVADEVNDYIQYLNDFFRNTNLPLDKSNSKNLTDYGKTLFFIMLGLLYDSNITRKIWTEVQYQRALPALETVLNSLGTNIQDEYLRFALWSFYAGNNALPNGFFPDGSLYPEVRSKTANPIKTSLTELVVDSLPRLSFQWYRSFSETSSKIKYLLKPEDNQQAEYLHAFLINLADRSYIRIRSGDARTLLFGIPMDGLPFATVNSFNSGQSLFKFRSISQPANHIDTIQVIVYPQPLKLNAYPQILKFENVPNNGEISIFNSNGKHLVSLKPPSGLPVLFWDLKTKYGETVGSGVYLYRVKSDTKEETGKFVVVR